MRAVPKIALLVTVVALLAGCGTVGAAATSTTTPTTPAPTDNGVPALPVSEIFTKAGAALKLASSIHVSQAANGGTVTVGYDVTINKQRDGLGTATVDGQKVQLTKIGTDLYVKAGADFWTEEYPDASGKTIGMLAAGKYLRAATTDPTLGFLASIFTLVDQVSLGGVADKGPIQTINGVPAISLVRQSDTTSTYWVATQGEPYLLRLQYAGDSPVDLTDYNKPVVIAAPPADQVSDVSVPQS